MRLAQPTTMSGGLITKCIVMKAMQNRQELVVPVCSLAEHVSAAGVAKFPLTAQTYFCEFPLRSPLRDVPLQPIFSHPLTAPLPL